MDLRPLNSETVCDLIANNPREYTVQMPDPDVLDYYEEEKYRFLWLHDDIDDSSMVYVKKIMMYNLRDVGIPVENRQPIVFIINSCGGNVDVMNAIIGAIETSKTPVYTVDIGVAYSAAAVILASGHKRFAMKNTSAMFHLGYTTLNGTNAQVKSAEKFYQACEKKTLSDLYAKTNFSASAKTKMKNDDVYFNTEEMLESKIIDKIIEDFEEIGFIK